jgi:MazG family protein
MKTDELNDLLFPVTAAPALKEKLNELDSFLPALKQAMALVARLRGPNGCPWDREQNHLTIRPYLIEEAYETLDVLDRYHSQKDPKAIAKSTPATEFVPADGAFTPTDQEALKEELGDLLLQVLLHAQLCWERDEFHVGDVARTMTEKLVRRHPHVFGDTSVEGSEGVLNNWEQIKKKEKQNKGGHSALDVPKGLPSLQRAERIGDKAGRLGFDWKRREDVWKKVEEEFQELKEALASGDPHHIEHEIGDLFFAASNLSRWYKIHPEDAHRKAISRFEKRFRMVEKWFLEQGKDMATADEPTLDAAWNWAKSQTKAAE